MINAKWMNATNMMQNELIAVKEKKSEPGSV